MKKKPETILEGYRQMVQDANLSNTSRNLNYIDGLINVSLFARFMQCAEDIIADIQEEDGGIDREDVIEYLCHELNSLID